MNATDLLSIAMTGKTKHNESLLCSLSTLTCPLPDAAVLGDQLTRHTSDGQAQPKSKVGPPVLARKAMSASRIMKV